jgi:hypothetical protein
VTPTSNEPTLRHSRDYVIRRCADGDVDRVAEFHAERTGPADAEDFRLVARDPAAGASWSAIAIHEPTGDVAASLTLLDERVRVGSVDVPAGQVEMVASARAHQGRGLVRALMSWSERESLRRGHLVQPMVGIPYFYRRFGYVYAAPLAGWVTMADDLSSNAPTGTPATSRATVRRAVHGDARSIREMIRLDQAPCDVAMTPSEACLGWMIERSGTEAWVAELDGRIVAFGRTLPAEEGAAVGDLFAGAADDAWTLAQAVRRPGLRVQVRPSTSTGRELRTLVGQPADAELDWLYVRIPDLVALLEHLRPELQRRLEQAELAVVPDRLLISSYRSHVVASIDNGRLGSFRGGGPLQAPLSEGGAGIPPDVWAALLFGPHGAVGLEQRHPDVLLGEIRDVMGALFPPMRSDVVTFYMT